MSEKTDFRHTKIEATLTSMSRLKLLGIIACHGICYNHNRATWGKYKLHFAFLIYVSRVSDYNAFADINSFFLKF